MDDIGIWDVTWMKGMIEAYHEASPIEDELIDTFDEDENDEDKDED